MHIIPQRETSEQLLIRLEIEAIAEEYKKRIEPLVKRYAALQRPPSFLVEKDIFDKYVQDEVIKP